MNPRRRRIARHRRKLRRQPKRRLKLYDAKNVRIFINFPNGEKIELTDFAEGDFIQVEPKPLAVSPVTREWTFKCDGVLVR